MAPLEPHWQQPSHPDIQEVIINEGDFSSKSLSKVAVAPFGVYANLTMPPCTIETQPTYATCQIGHGKHVSLNSDLLYMNHSCEPSLVSSLCQAGQLKPGQKKTPERSLAGKCMQYETCKNADILSDP